MLGNIWDLFNDEKSFCTIAAKDTESVSKEFKRDSNPLQNRNFGLK